MASETGRPDSFKSWVQLSRLEISSNLPVEVSRWIDQVTEFATKTLLHGN